MRNKQSLKTYPLFKPISSITYVSDKGKTEIAADSVIIELVGEKAYGLSCLPRQWTLPFIVVSDKLLFYWNNSDKQKQNQLITRWAQIVYSAAVSIGIEEKSPIIVRSSGQSEGLEERGMLYSAEGKLDNITHPLIECLQKLSSDKDARAQGIPLIIQKRIYPIFAKGHLSNERRCYYEKRDWLGDYDILRFGEGKPFSVNLRGWRRSISAEERTNKPLLCSLTPHISEVLKIPAQWGYNRKKRLHYEWVWDGKLIYLVQADQEHETVGVEPAKLGELQKSLPPKFTPKCLRQIDEVQAKKYEKIRNVFIYSKLELPTINLYALDDQSVINSLANGKLPIALHEDLAELVKGSLVIRMDIATNDIRRRQLLPRTHEVRELDCAVEWLKEKSAEIRRHRIEEDVVFIFHNFVPSISSAFAYAAPGERIVQIEALWGLPEGLYYNKHDKFIVDTKTPELGGMRYDDISPFKVQEKVNYKQFFIVPDKNGHWETKILKPPYDWNKSIKFKKWIDGIAFESRRIAEMEGKSLSIMWFVGVPKGVCSRRFLPWYHEPYDPLITSRAPSHRTKTPFDKSLIIKTNEDIEVLRKEAEKQHSSVRRVRIQPSEEALLRDKDTLRVIGELTQKIGAIILLEGGVLSHAYYQLMETNAIVEVLHPFGDFEDKRDFNKLVRDKVPSNIKRGGEIVSKARLSGEFLLKALREKLIEEAFEVLDAVDQDSIVGELADVTEIIDGILLQLGVSRNELFQRQNRKRKKAGGFKNGIVLLETENPMPTKKRINTDSLFRDFSPSVEPNNIGIDNREVFKMSHAIDKWSDRREHHGESESILRIVIPMVRDTWKVDTPEKKLESCSGDSVRAKVKITGKRQGAKIQINLSIFTPQQQLKLF